MIVWPQHPPHYPRALQGAHDSPSSHEEGAYTGASRREGARTHPGSGASRRKGARPGASAPRREGARACTSHTESSSTCTHTRTSRRREGRLVVEALRIFGSNSFMYVHALFIFLLKSYDYCIGSTRRETFTRHFLKISTAIKRQWIIKPRL